uniref:Ankyrin repeat and sterile alpha motif domain containing 3 n=1 Tax=Macaca nemestrina TaxID=9545 RepID=A0A2K6D843_MACNE
MSELSDEASEPELLNRSLSMWHGLGAQVSREELDVPLDLHTAASIGQYEVVKECVQREPIYGFTPLMEAAAAGHEIIVQYFLNHVNWSAVARSRLTATSAFQVQAVLLPQPPE